MYTCSQCNKWVIVLNWEIIKACPCDASVIANASSSLTWMGGVTI
jgi:hypothetical protein